MRNMSCLVHTLTLKHTHRISFPVQMGFVLSSGVVLTVKTTNAWSKLRALVEQISNMFKYCVVEWLLVEQHPLSTTMCKSMSIIYICQLVVLEGKSFKRQHTSYRYDVHCMTNCPAFSVPWPTCDRALVLFDGYQSSKTKEEVQWLRKGNYVWNSVFIHKHNHCRCQIVGCISDTGALTMNKKSEL